MREGLSRLPLALVLIAFCSPLFIGLGSSDLDNDEAIYSYAVESILTTGDWLGPRSSPSPDEIFLEKPHLKLWLVAAPIRLGLLPLDEFGLRFWDAALGGVAFVYVFLIGQRLAGPVAGLMAVLVLFVHGPLIFDHGFRSNNMDASLVAAYCGGVYHYLRWADGAAERGRRKDIAAVGLWFYAGFMSKFVAAIFLPAVIGLCAVVVPAHRARLIEDWRRWLITAAAVVAGAVPWFAYQHLRHGQDFWNVLFGEHVVTRFTTFVDPSHVRRWNFYVVEGYRQFARTGSAIWVGLGLLALTVDALRRRTTSGWVVLAWAALPLAAISFGTSKLYHYAYPFVPPFALAAGYAVAVLARSAGRLLRAPSILERMRPGIRSPVRAAALVILFASVALIVATGVTGTLQLQVGEQILFRNSSLLRPAVLAVICAAIAVDVRIALGALVVWGLSAFVHTPVLAYGDSLRQIGSGRRPLGLLARCIEATHQSRTERGLPAGTYAPVSDGYLHQYFYYFRGSGWLPSTIDDELVRTALFVPGQARVIVMDTRAYAEFLDRAGTSGRLPAAVERPMIVVLLPGEYRACRATQAPVPR